MGRVGMNCCLNLVLKFATLATFAPTDLPIDQGCEVVRHQESPHVEGQKKDVKLDPYTDRVLCDTRFDQET